jgi:glycosyltransferase involved in cell wall biosynthesis
MKSLFICNGFTVNMSGGDYHMMNIASHWSKNSKVSYMLPKLGYTFVRDLLAGESFVVNTPFESKANGFMNVILLYLLRTAKMSFYNVGTAFEVVLASSHYPFDVIPAFMYRLKNPGSLFVVYFHGLSIPDGKASAKLVSTFYNMFGLLIARFADLVFVINSDSKTLLLKQGISSEKIVKTSNGVEMDNLTPVIDAKSFEACFLGRLVKYKGVFDILYVWKKVCQVIPNAKLAILGDGPEKESIVRVIKELSLERNIVLFGFVFGSEKLSLLKSAKLFLSPSYLESWGISVAEAMSCGLPVIAYNLPVYAEVFDDHIVTVPLGNVSSLAEKVVTLLNNTDLSQKIGEDGKKFVKKYQWSSVAELQLQSVNSAYKNKHARFNR